jgi:hypothetical protein
MILYPHPFGGYLETNFQEYVEEMYLPLWDPSK